MMSIQLAAISPQGASHCERYVGHENTDATCIAQRHHAYMVYATHAYMHMYITP